MEFIETAKYKIGTEAEAFESAGLVCPNDCPAGTGWTFSEMAVLKRNVSFREDRNGRAAVLVESNARQSYGEDGCFECDGCDCSVLSGDVTYDWATD